MRVPKRSLLLVFCGLHCVRGGRELRRGDEKHHGRRSLRDRFRLSWSKFAYTAPPPQNLSNSNTCHVILHHLARFWLQMGPQQIETTKRQAQGNIPVREFFGFSLHHSVHMRTIHAFEQSQMSGTSSDIPVPWISESTFCCNADVSLSSSSLAFFYQSLACKLMLYTSLLWRFLSS